MKKIKLEVADNNFYGEYYLNDEKSPNAIIYLLGPTRDSFLVKMGVKWLKEYKINVLAISPTPEMKGYHSLPLEWFSSAITYLKSQGIKRIGIAGGSATAMISLVVSSYFNDISLTICFTPCDFMMQGYLRDGLDKTKERPAENESILSKDGKALAYLPYYYKHPVYWQKIKEESKRTKNIVASLNLFNKSEINLKEEMMIKVEKIEGTLVLVGAKDDVLWDTVKYISRMKERIESNQSKVDLRVYTYKYGTHFVFPDKMLKLGLGPFSGTIQRLFLSGRRNAKECKKTRLDIEDKLDKILKEFTFTNPS